ncbi:MAG: hypothetical protein R3F11_20460 [Verrucomicrobiales bacterium]
MDTPGTAQRLVCAPERIAVADGPAVSPSGRNFHFRPPAASSPSAPLSGDTDNVAATGTSDRHTTAGDVLWWTCGPARCFFKTPPPGQVRDLSVEGGFLYALTASRLHAIETAARRSTSGASLQLPDRPGCSPAVALSPTS